MPLFPWAHLNATSGEVLLPAAAHSVRRLFVAHEFLGVVRLHARVDKDWRAEGGVIVDEFALRRAQVAGGVKAGKGRPEEVHRRADGPLGVVAEHQERPVGKGRIARDVTAGGSIRCKAGTLDDEASRREDEDLLNPRRGPSRELGGQFAALFSETQEDPLAALV